MEIRFRKNKPGTGHVFHIKETSTRRRSSSLAQAQQEIQAGTRHLLLDWRRVSM
jgi:hypothetical protein